jgi:hypothetical protein
MGAHQPGCPWFDQSLSTREGLQSARVATASSQIRAFGHVELESSVRADVCPEQRAQGPPILRDESLGPDRIGQNPLQQQGICVICQNASDVTAAANALAADGASG